MIGGMNERYIKWYTPWLSREFEMLVFGNGGGLPLILYPTSFGRYYQNKDFGLVGSIAWYIIIWRTCKAPSSADFADLHRLGKEDSCSGMCRNLCNLRLV